MRFCRTIRVVETHTAGMPTRVVVAGFPAIPGETMADKARHLMASQELRRLATMICDEPRGHAGQFGALLTPPTTPGARAGIVFFAPEFYAGGCGHGTIGVATALVETGVIAEPLPTTFTLDTPVGAVEVRANGSGGELESISFRNVPSFCVPGEVTLRVEGLGKVPADIAYGGNYYAYVSARDVGVAVRVENLPELRRVGTLLLEAAREQVRFESPSPDIRAGFGAVMIRDEPLNPEAQQRNIVMGTTGFDRSPCGTGTSGWLAVLHAKGRLAAGETFVHESVIGSLFRGRVLEETHIGGWEAIVPEITGSAYVTALHDLVLDPRDPYPRGFKTFR